MIKLIISSSIYFFKVSSSEQITFRVLIIAFTVLILCVLGPKEFQLVKFRVIDDFLY